MPDYADSRCSECGLFASPELLTIKRVQFASMENPKRTIKQRAIAKLCEKCLDADPDWHRDPYSGPNNKSAPLERVRSAQRGRQSG